jgi:anti-anti-sigma factor
MLLHGSESERQAGLTAWVGRGLELGEKIIYTERPGAADRSLFAVLEAHALDTDVARRDGQIVVLPLEEFYPPTGHGPLVERALAEGFAAVRMSAEVSDALTLLTPDTHLRMERDMNQLCRRLPVSTMCQYERSTTTGIRLRDTVGVHVTGMRQARFATDEDDHGLILHGEIDIANADVFAAVVATAAKCAARTVWLDLAGVDYVDAATCRVLLDASYRFRAGGGHLLLVAPQPRVERTLRLLDLDMVRGVRLLGGEP